MLKRLSRAERKDAGFKEVPASSFDGGLRGGRAFREGMDSGEAALFNEHRILPDDFTRSIRTMEALHEAPEEIVVNVFGRYYSWKAAAPYLVAHALWGQNLDRVDEGSSGCTRSSTCPPRSACAPRAAFNDNAPRELNRVTEQRVG